MHMRELIGLGFPEDLVHRWISELGPELLPVQAQALTRYEVLNGGRLLVSAPTSSGKSWLAEMAAVHAGLHDGRVFILVPLRALAEEKAHDLRARYAGYGLDVAVTSRDHREDDERILAGDVSIVVSVYEKALALLFRRPELLRRLNLVVADELQILNDPDRGPDAELLLTLLRTGAPQARLLGLSAVVGNPEALSRWLDARLLVVTERPVPLRRGILHQGVYRYRSDLGEEGEESFPEVCGKTWEAMLVQTVRACVEREEQVLVFLPSRAESRAWAVRLSESISVAPAAATLDQLAPLQETASRRLLQQTLRRGVAFHNGDLLAEERWAVEAGARSGEIKVVVATTTLASGINIPAKTVVISPTTWSGGPRSTEWFRQPISQAMFEAMAGRAGRLRLQDDFGRAILLAPTPFHRDSLQRYLNRSCEPVIPRLREGLLERPVFVAVATDQAGTPEGIRQWLGQTLSGQGGWMEGPRIPEELDAVIARGRALGAIRISDGGQMELTALGQAVARSGIDLATATSLSRWLASCGDNPSTLELLLAVCTIPGTATVPVPLPKTEYRSRRYENQIWNQGIHSPWTVKEDAGGRTSYLDYDQVRACKLALALQDWLEGVPLSELEAHYGMGAGIISRAAEEVGFFIQSILEVAQEAGAPHNALTRIEDVASRLPYGVRPAGLNLARLRVRGMGRDHISRLIGAGFENPQALREVPLEALEKVIPATLARRLLARVQDLPDPADPTPPPRPGEPILILDPADPGTVRYRGKVVSLTPLEYRLLLTLARSPQQTVGYDRLYDALWGSERFVERNQILYHKSRLLRKLREAAGETDPPPIVANVGHGLRLTIPTEAVVVKSGQKSEGD